MANSYQQSSSYLDIPEDKLEAAKRIVDRVRRQLAVEEAKDFGCSEEELSDPGFCLDEYGISCEVDFEESGIWLHHEESFDPYAAEIIARAVIEELQIDKAFFCTWANTCSKPRLDEFGGGGFVILRGHETYWTDVWSELEDKLSSGGLKPLDTH
jgi:hypothetical protein